MQKKLKVLHINTAYGSLTTGSAKDPILWYRYLFRTKKLQNKFIKEIQNIIKKENPDVIFFTEIKQDDPLIKALAPSYPYFKIESKYRPNHINREIPIAKNNSNGFFSKIQPKRVIARHMKTGQKTLVLEVEFEYEKFFLVHFSLSKQARLKNQEEICQMLDEKESKNIIILGDFNSFQGHSEFQYSCMNKFELAIKKPTFPAVKPFWFFDNFLLPKGLNYKTRVINNGNISDHRPVILEIKDRKNIDHQRKEKYRIDYHFHPNLPGNQKRAERKAKKIWKLTHKNNINVLISTEHIYNNPERAYSILKKYKPKGKYLFPGLEYQTADNLNFVIFSKEPSIFSYSEFNKSMTTKKLLNFLKLHNNLYFFLIRKDIKELEKKQLSKLLQENLKIIEVASGDLLKHSIKRWSKGQTRTGQNNNKDNQKRVLIETPKSFLSIKIPSLSPKDIKAIAVGSNAYSETELGNCLIIEKQTHNQEIFDLIINSKKGRIFIKPKEYTIVGFTKKYLTKIYRWWRKKIN